MKSRIFSLLTAAVLLICVVFLGTRFYGWWHTQQKRKALFIYFQKKSPLTRRVPEDALIYLNLYDFKRVHGDLQGTKFYDVLAHWLDTGFSDKQKANSFLGGMVEKTALNLFGEEFAAGLLPSTERNFDFVAITRMSGGSDFFLKLALASSKNARRLGGPGAPIYLFTTKNPLFPEVFVSLNEDLAYASSSLPRLRQAMSQEGIGPSFLQELRVEAISENTILFARGKEGALSVLVYGEGSRYHLQASSKFVIHTSLPEPKEDRATVLYLQTNGTELLKQPAVSYVLQTINGEPASTLSLNGGEQEIKLPLTLKIHFHREPIVDYFQRVKSADWSRFSGAKEFYFLSCLKELKGGIDGSENELSLEVN